MADATNLPLSAAAPVYGIAVDDSEVNLMILVAHARNLGISLKTFTRADEALEYIQSGNAVDIIFTDYKMSPLDGVEFVRRIHPQIPHVPIIMITFASTDETLRLTALQAGATDFLARPLHHAEFQARVTNLLRLREARLELEERNRSLEQDIRQATFELRQREEESLLLLGRAADYRDPETGHHLVRVAAYAKLLASQVGLSGHEQDLLFHAAPLHDVGKIGIPDALLLKPGKLSGDEFEFLKSHTTIGYEILHNTRSRYLQAGALVALSHHEKYDGSGYPYGRRGQEIPLFGRIVAIADTFDALTTARPYKPAWPLEEAFRYLEIESGRHFDPELVASFMFRREDVEKIYSELVSENEKDQLLSIRSSPYPWQRDESP